jgi:hypothetical protein
LILLNFLPENYIVLSLKDSTVISQIYSTENSPKESLEISPHISLKESPHNSPIESPRFPFLSPKEENLETPQTSLPKDSKKEE